MGGPPAGPDCVRLIKKKAMYEWLFAIGPLTPGLHSRGRQEPGFKKINRELALELMSCKVSNLR